MPPSFRRLLKRVLDAKIEQDEPALDWPEAREEGSREQRPPARGHALVILIGCCLLVAVCGLGVVTGLWRRVLPSTRSRIDYAALATSSFQTALAADLGTLTAHAPAPPAQSTPSPEATQIVATTTAEPAVNPWVAQIPDAACIPKDIPQTGRVVDVVDGDTIKVLMDGDGRVHSVHYIGVEAPSSNGGLSLAGDATRRNAELVYHKQVTMVRDITDADGSGTLQRYVMVEGLFVNYELVSGGYAAAVASAPDSACLNALQATEERAKAAGLGLWGASGSILPQPTSP